MRIGRACVAAGLALAVLCGAPGRASGERYVYQLMAGAGVAAVVTPGAAALPAASFFSKHVYGLTDRLNLASPSFLEMDGRGGVAVSGGTGLEVVLLATNHWRVAMGGGLALRVPFDATVEPAVVGPLQGGAYGAAGARWLFAWGVGLALELHGGIFAGIDGTVGPFVGQAALALYSEWW